MSAGSKQDLGNPLLEAKTMGQRHGNIESDRFVLFFVSMNRT